MNVSVKGEGKGTRSCGWTNTFSYDKATIAQSSNQTKKTPNITQRRYTKTNKKMNKNTKTNTVTKIHINTNRHGREYGQIRRESVWKIIQIRT